MASNGQRTDRRTDRQTETNQPAAIESEYMVRSEWEVDNMFPSTGLVCDDVNSGGVAAAIEDPLAQTIRCHRVLQPLH